MSNPIELDLLLLVVLRLLALRLLVVVSSAALMLTLLLAVRLISPSVALKLTPVRVMLPCTWLVGLVFELVS